MDSTDLGHVIFSKPEKNIILIEAKEGVEINREKSALALDVLEQHVDGNYGMIFNRINDYSIAPVEVYEEINQRERLHAIAIITHRKTSDLNIHLEKNLYKRKLESFHSIEHALDWIKPILTCAQS